MEKRTFTFLMIIFVLALVGAQSVFTVHQTQKAIILQLGEPIGTTLGPGLHFKLPFVQNVLFFDSRVLNYDARPADALTSDKKAIVLDNYARWRIVDPLAFYRTLRTVQTAQSRLDDIIYSQLRAVVGQYTLTQVVSSKRQEIMNLVMSQANAFIGAYGVDVVDVRIKRTDLPPENQRAIFGRMKAERERQATQYRSEGQEEATRLRSASDRDRVILLADAQLKGEIIRGEGDAEATRVFGQAVGQNPDFYEFTRSLLAYRKALKENTRFILSPDDSFLRYLRQQ